MNKMKKQNNVNKQTESVLEKIEVLGVSLNPISKGVARGLLNTKQVIFTPNPEILVQAYKNKAYRKALRKGTLFLPDGHGLQLVTTLLGLPKLLRFLLYFPALIVFFFYKKPFQKIVPEVIRGSDFIETVIEEASEKGLKVYFLGAAEGVGKKCADVFEEKYPELNIVGISSGHADLESFNLVKTSGAQVVLVAFGAPKQEFWISKYASQLPDLKLIMGVGGSFDYWSGHVKRAPLFMRKLGLEWLFRLMLQPRLRLKRIFTALIVFPFISFYVES
jgi:N-acetylglucosaminyldiphosphoundecaprenol N-acetyl-beta-D-mannosaminyltransferase